MIKKPKLRVAGVAAALLKAEGNRTAAATELGVTRAKLSAFIERNNSLLAVEKEIRESWVDAAEAELISNEGKTDFRRLQLILKTHGTSRGYGVPPPPKPYEPYNVVSSVPRPDYDSPDDDPSATTTEDD